MENKDRITQIRWIKSLNRQASRTSDWRLEDTDGDYLATLAQSSDSRVSDLASTVLVELLRPLIGASIKQSICKVESLIPSEDLTASAMSAGLVGLSEALNKWTPETGKSFIGYAHPRFRNTIEKVVKSGASKRPGTLTEGESKVLASAAKATEKFAEEHGRPASTEELKVATAEARLSYAIESMCNTHGLQKDDPKALELAKKNIAKRGHVRATADLQHLLNVTNAEVVYLDKPVGEDGVAHDIVGQEDTAESTWDGMSSSEINARLASLMPETASGRMPSPEARQRAMLNPIIQFAMFEMDPDEVFSF